MTDIANDWNAVAEAWDAHVDDVDQHSIAATDALVAALGVQAGDRVLELACGPGSLGPTWAHLSGPTGAVVLSDIAPDMVEVAARRNARFDTIRCEVIDASHIDHPDASFDVVAERMGLMFAPDPARVLAEVRRVLTPGGRFGALTWGAIEHNPWMTCVGMAAMVNGLVSSGPPDGPGGIFSLGDPAQLEQLATDAGFAEVAVSVIDLSFVEPDIDTHVSRVMALAGPLAPIFAGATADQDAAVRRTAADLAAPHVSDEGVALPGRALLLRAVS